MIKEIKKNSKIICYLLAFIIPVIFMLIISNALNFSPFGNRSPLVADMSVQFEVYYTYLKSVFFGNNDLFYTFSKTIGGDMAGFSFYYIGNPFAYFLVFLPNEYLPMGVLFIIILLMALSSLNFNIMLNNVYGFRWSSLLFSISYAFIGYFMAYYNFIIFFNNIMVLPIIVLGLYEIVEKEKTSFKYIVFLAISIITNYYIGYMTCIFCGILFVYFIVIKIRDAKNIKRHLLTLWRFIWESSLAVMISAVALFTVFFSLMKGQKIDGDFGMKIAGGLNFRMRDVFSGFYTLAFNGNISNGLPVIYCGSFAIVFLFLYFLNKEIKIKEKIASFTVILIFFISFYVKFINRIWHGMAETVGFPYRYSFFLCFFILFISFKAFILIKQGTRKYHTLVIFVIFTLYSIYMLISRNEYVGIPQIILTGAFVSMYLCGVYAICYKREYMYPITIGFLLIISFDVLLNGHYSISKYYNGSDDEKSSVQYYDDYYQSLNDIYEFTLNDNGTDGFYRMDKLFRLNHNDAMHVGYHGLSHFSSTESSDVLDFMNELGFCSNNMWSYYGEDGNTAFVDSILSLKYLISQYDTTGKPYKHIGTVDDKYVFKNPYALQLAIETCDDIQNIDREKYNHFTLQNEIAKGITGKAYGIYRPVEVVDVKLENVEKYEKSYTRIDADKDAFIEYDLNITSNDFIYMYFDAPSTQNTKITVNDVEKTDYFTTYGWCVRNAGYFKENTIVPIRIYLNQDEIEIDGYEFYYESKEELKRWYEDTTSSYVKVDKVKSSHLIVGADIAEDRDRLVFSMPYDEGWHIYVDGIETEAEPVLDVLLSVKLNPGRHVIELKYTPRGFVAGSIISIIGVLILLILYIIEVIRIKRILKGE